MPIFSFVLWKFYFMCCELPLLDTHIYNYYIYFKVLAFSTILECLFLFVVISLSWSLFCLIFWHNLVQFDIYNIYIYIFKWTFLEQFYSCRKIDLYRKFPCSSHMQFPILTSYISIVYWLKLMNKYELLLIQLYYPKPMLYLYCLSFDQTSFFCSGIPPKIPRYI